MDRFVSSFSTPSVQLIYGDRTTHVGGTDVFNVVFIGAGNIMFGGSAFSHLSHPNSSSPGSDEGPWNHSFRFEQ